MNDTYEYITFLYDMGIISFEEFTEKINRAINKENIRIWKQLNKDKGEIIWR